jgi:hypothetical protein
MPETLTVPRLVALFDDPDVFLRAATAARKRGWKQLDAVTPYPLHGSVEALGLKMSWVPYVTVTAGLAGALLGFLFEAWTLSVDWPINIGGKPQLAWQAYVPIMFECGILVGGISTFVAMWFACRLPKSNPQIYDKSLTEDKFALIVPLEQGVNESEATSFLRGEGAQEVRHVEI